MLPDVNKMMMMTKYAINVTFADCLNYLHVINVTYLLNIFSLL